MRGSGLARYRGVGTGDLLRLTGASVCGTADGRGKEGEGKRETENADARLQSSICGPLPQSGTGGEKKRTEDACTADELAHGTR